MSRTPPNFGPFASAREQPFALIFSCVGAPALGYYLTMFGMQALGLPESDLPGQVAIFAPFVAARLLVRR
ncbi:MAG TPA: hypothetical protein PK359_04700 [Burkholderiaceae bacterium]|nr:hypothetical protein [Burkholderiaceae bacterium]